MDYAVYLDELSKLAPDVPLMLEHMKKKEGYLAGARYIRAVAEQEGIPL